MWKHNNIYKTSRLLMGEKLVVVAEGREGISDCGCRWTVGIRLDLGEVVFYTTPCGNHGQLINDVTLTLKTMPPNDRQIAELFEDLFEKGLS